MDDILLFFSLKYFGDWQKIYNALERKEKINHQELKHQKQEINLNHLTVLNQFYPANLKNTHKPPFVLFYEGDISLINNYHQIIGIFGDEEFNNYAENNLNKFIHDLNQERRIILTSFQNGIEKKAIEIAIQNKAKIIVVLKEGINNFLIENKEILNKIRKTQYLIISESYNIPSSTTTDIKILESHSRLKSALCKGLLIIQTKRNSLTTKVINYALNDGKEIFAIPENICSRFKGNNLLIKQGAKLCESAIDILNEI